MCEVMRVVVALRRQTLKGLSANQFWLVVLPEAKSLPATKKIVSHFKVAEKRTFRDSRAFSSIPLRGQIRF